MKAKKNTGLASAAACKPLYNLIKEIYDLSPWDWMEEDDIFGVQDPTTGEIGFVSVMGMAGEHYAVGVYRGANGLYGFFRLRDSDPFSLGPEDLLNIPQLQASLEDREMLDKRDRDQIKSLGLKFRGRKAWPLFRSYRPGYLPWHIETDEARFLGHVLEQVMAVAPRVRENPDILQPGGDKEFLVRVADTSGPLLTWGDTIMSIDPPPPTTITVSIADESLVAISQLPKKEFQVEVDYFMMMTPIGSGDERPYLPYALFIIDAAEGIPVHAQLIGPDPSHEEMWGSLGQQVLDGLEKLSSRPTELRFRDEMLYRMLKPFEKRLEIKVKLVGDLPAFDRFASSMMDIL